MSVEPPGAIVCVWQLCTWRQSDGTHETRNEVRVILWEDLDDSVQEILVYLRSRGRNLLFHSFNEFDSIHSNAEYRVPSSLQFHVHPSGPQKYIEERLYPNVNCDDVEPHWDAMIDFLNWKDGWMKGAQLEYLRDIPRAWVVHIHPETNWDEQVEKLVMLVYNACVKK
jgi:hypothetical protein